MFCIVGLKESNYMLGSYYDDIERSGDGCSFGCTCPACCYDRELNEQKQKESRYTYDEEKPYYYKSRKSGK